MYVKRGPPVLRNDKTPRAEAQGVLVDIRSASNGASLQRFTHFVPFTHRRFPVCERKLSWCWRDLQGTDSPFSFRKRRTRRPSRSVAARRPLLHPSWPLAVAGWAFRVFPARASSPKQMWVQRGPSWSSLHLQSAGLLRKSHRVVADLRVLRLSWVSLELCELNAPRPTGPAFA